MVLFHKGFTTVDVAREEFRLAGLRGCQSSTDSVYCLFSLNTGCFKCLLNISNVATRVFLIRESDIESTQHMFKLVIIHLCLRYISSPQK